MFFSPILAGKHSSAALDAGRCTVQILTLRVNELLAENWSINCWSNVWQVYHNYNTLQLQYAWMYTCLCTCPYITSIHHVLFQCILPLVRTAPVDAPPSLASAMLFLSDPKLLDLLVMHWLCWKCATNWCTSYYYCWLLLLYIWWQHTCFLLWSFV